MIRLDIPVNWSERISTDTFVANTRAIMYKLLARWPGYIAHEIEVDHNYDRLWLWIKPTDDYEMDEGL